MEIFAHSSGLVANSTKFDIYIAGFPTPLKAHTVDVCKIHLGSMPFRNSGVPLYSKRLSAAECEHLIVKMISRIRSWQARNVSYAARMQLVFTVLMNITNFWCWIFVLPKRVLKHVNAICRAYLWHGEADSNAPGNVNWARICTPKKFDGLGIRYLVAWNLAAMGKLVWHVSYVRESMWVRWIHGVYTKGWNLRVFNVPITSNWTFKKICKVKDLLGQWVH